MSNCSYQRSSKQRAFFFLSEEKRFCKGIENRNSFLASTLSLIYLRVLVAAILGEEHYLTVARSYQKIRSCSVRPEGLCRLAFQFSLTELACYRTRSMFRKKFTDGNQSLENLAFNLLLETGKHRFVCGSDFLTICPRHLIYFAVCITDVSIVST